ncbi:hypothetical protein [Streptacidiphilus sp. EB103A]|uniref:hypothetical protein n=1 Tax=Streptacidiphilus sp. EB103A TaxID=3156275 RepID=UPI0035194D90
MAHPLMGAAAGPADAAAVLDRGGERKEANQFGALGVIVEAAEVAGDLVYFQADATGGQAAVECVEERLARVYAEAGDLPEVRVVEVEVGILEKQDSIPGVDDGADHQGDDACLVRVGDQFS